MALLSVDEGLRKANERAHTATHLLHAFLVEIFPQTKQAWSYVGPDELRFDFFSDRFLTASEQESIVSQINESIARSDVVDIQEMPYREAVQTNAKAFFEEKYPEIVRVVSIGQGEKKAYSVELCGGTHVQETSQIGAFFISEQTTVASWIKRIVALTGPKVASQAMDFYHSLENIAEHFSVSRKQLDAKIEKVLTEKQECEHQVDQLSVWLLALFPWNKMNIGDFSFDTIRNFDENFLNIGLNFKLIVDQLKMRYYNKSRILYSESGQYALHHPQAKSFIQSQGRKWWGSDDFIQWRDEKVRDII